MLCSILLIDDLWLYDRWLGCVSCRGRRLFGDGVSFNYCCFNLTFGTCEGVSRYKSSFVTGCENTNG